MTARARIYIYLVPALATTIFLLLAGPASAASPWWLLGSGSRPANLRSGIGQSEKQEIKITTESGAAAFSLSVNGVDLGLFATEPLAGELELIEMSAANIQAALEGPYGPGNVEVTEQVSGPTISYLVTSKGDKAFQLVSPVKANPEGIGTAEAVVTAPGRPDGEIVLNVENVGDAPANGSGDPIVVADTLPPTLTPARITATYPTGANQVEPVPCQLSTLTCEFDGSLPPYLALEVRILVRVGDDAHSGELNRLSVSGGGAPAKTITRPIVISTEPTPFGLEEYGLHIEGEGGVPATAAASHPFQVTGVVALNQGANDGSKGESNYRPIVEPAELAKDIYTKLPPGLLGNPSPLPACSLARFLRNNGNENACPANTAIGVASVNIFDPGLINYAVFTVPVFNLEASYGEPARFGFFVPASATPVLLDATVRSGAQGDYGVTLQATNVTQTAGLLSARVTFWGTPGDPLHDSSRGWGCLYDSLFHVSVEEPCQLANQVDPPAFLSLPTVCGGPLQTAVEADAWITAGQFQEFNPVEPLQTLDGCNRIPFAPDIDAEPTSNAATSPTGLKFEINVDDEGLNNPEGLSQSQIKKAVVTLPEGFTTNPSVAEGLNVCTEAQYESETVNSEAGSGCPNASKVGDIEIESPLIKGKIVPGSLFVAQQRQNPNANLLTIYLVAKNPELGIIIKQALKVTPDPVTGQLTTEVDDIPQLPFSHFHLSLRQGQRSPLITPPTCGPYTVNAELYPWSNPTAPLHRESSFQITQGPEGNPCPSGNTPPFHPGLEAGTQNNAAGTYSPFYVHLTRKDSEQEITHFSIKLPPGVSGKLAGIPYCPDAAIAAAKAREREGGGTEELNAPSCPQASEVGHSLVGSGVGNVLAYAPGKMYLAGPYHGSNLSLVSITAAKVGPFDLGTVVVRFALKIDPETAEVSVDGQSSDPIPHIVDGIPVHLRDIRAYVDRKNFVLNPTSCKKTSTASTVLGSGLNFASAADDQPVTVTSPFQAADCASLAFKPKLALSLKGGTHRGATPAFKAVLTYPKGSYANIASSQVTLPHSEFLEQAHIGTVCTRAQFKEGKTPGEKCPAASIYGRARAITPILAEPLEGPVYLRSSSHQLPDLVAALHNSQVDIALDGRIDSVQNGRIRNTFEAVPDAPVSKFVLEMQGGKKGLLVNSTNICAKRNRAISHFVGQNGKASDSNPVLAARCGAKAKKKGQAKKGKRHS